MSQTSIDNFSKTITVVVELEKTPADFFHQVDEGRNEKNCSSSEIEKESKELRKDIQSNALAWNDNIRQADVDYRKEYNLSLLEWASVTMGGR